MATQYYLACISCKEFINIYKLRLTGNILPLGVNEVTISKIQNELAELENEKEVQWIKNIAPLIHTFLHQHSEHKLVLVNNSGNYFWEPEFP